MVPWDKNQMNWATNSKVLNVFYESIAYILRIIISTPHFQNNLVLKKNMSITIIFIVITKWYKHDFFRTFLKMGWCVRFSKWCLGCCFHFWVAKTPSTKKCQLCLAEKFKITDHPEPDKLLNKRSEIISKCRHQRRFNLALFDTADWRHVKWSRDIEIFF